VPGTNEHRPYIFIGRRGSIFVGCIVRPHKIKKFVTMPYSLPAPPPQSPATLFKKFPRALAESFTPLCHRRPCPIAALRSTSTRHPPHNRHQLPGPHRPSSSAPSVPPTARPTPASAKTAHSPRPRAAPGVSRSPVLPNALPCRRPP
jgi:hypothetical protein